MYKFTYYCHIQIYIKSGGKGHWVIEVVNHYRPWRDRLLPVVVIIDHQTHHHDRRQNNEIFQNDLRGASGKYQLWVNTGLKSLFEVFSIRVQINESLPIAFVEALDRSDRLDFEAESERVPLKPELADNNKRCILEYQTNKDQKAEVGNKMNTLVISYDVERDNEEHEIQVEIDIDHLEILNVWRPLGTRLSIK